jgi:endonuclease G
VDWLGVANIGKEDEVEINLRVAEEAARRWQERSSIREPRRAKLKEGQALDVESSERVQKRLDRLAAVATEAKAAGGGPGMTAAPAAPFLVETIGLERVLGKPDFLGMNFMELALAVSRFVGRIHIRRSPGRTAGFGTGFMVSPRLLLTNNHVLGAPQDALYSEVEFDYQYDRYGRLLPVVVYGLEPQAFFLTDRELDYTLVAVREQSISNIPLKRYGWSRLIAEQGKALLGESLNIIQHPKGEAKQIVLRSNQLVDLLDQFAHYVTDTEPGSSGSPVYNDQWEVVALHHSGVPKMQNGNYIAKDGSIWTPGMDPEELEWVANEGIRVSSLVDHIKKQVLPAEQQRLREEMLNQEPPHPIDAANMAQEAGSDNSQSVGRMVTPTAEPGTYTWTIPLQISVRLGFPTGAGGQIPSPAPSSGTTVPVTDGSRATLPASVTPPVPERALREALAELEAATTRAYYDEEEDRNNRDAYYQGLSDQLSPGERYERLSELLKETHKNRLQYQPSKQVYPWVDLHEAQPKPVLKSIYSGREFDPREFIEEDFRIEQERLRLREVLTREASFGAVGAQEQLDLLEASLPYNCEHVVPQSWFGKREPMRGDLHHLFACEVGCNSFRGNIPYYDFPDFEEAVREACGKLEKEQLKFEPSAGKGAVARATLYFLLRYPKEINRTNKEYTEERIRMLLKWHENHEVRRYEKHRNAAIFQKQGNRNPLIDFPEWAGQIDFTLGLG